MSLLQALQIRQSLPLEWRRVIRTEYSHKLVREPFIHFNGTLLPLYKCTTRFIYECYVQMKYVTPTSVLKWKTLHEDFDMSEEEWTDVFLRPYICLRETELQSFQYKIIHRIINCNKKLFDMRIKNSPYVHIATKQMISVTSSSCVKMCMNSGERYVPGGIRLIMMGLTFQRIRKSKNYNFRIAGCHWRRGCPKFPYISHKILYIYRQRLFRNNVFRLHEIHNEIVAKLEIEKNIC